MKNFSKLLMSLAILLIFSFAGKAQSLDFELSKDTIYSNQTVQIYNRSTGFSASNQYRFEFSPCQFYENASVHSCTLTKNLNDTITGFFSGAYIDSVTISLFALDSLGNQLSYTPKTTTIIILTPKYPIWTIDSCHENINICQNLACNGDFEWFSDTIFTNQNISYAQPWNDFGFTTTDYYNEITSTYPQYSIVGVPNNYNGYQYDKYVANGNKAYAGIISYITSQLYYREYIISQLKDTLIAGQRYNVSLDINLADTSRYAINGVQVLFTDTSISNVSYSTNNYILPNWSSMNNLIDYFGNNIVNDTANWTTFNAVFIPYSNNLNWINIGNFKPNSNLVIDSNTISGCDYAYYYIDNISVIPLPPDITITGDTIFCDSNSVVPVTLKAVGPGAAFYLWSNSSTADSLVVSPSVTTTYYVTTTDYHNCNTVVDSVTITIQPDHNVIITGDTSFCDTNSVPVTIKAFGTGITSYFWSNNSTVDSIIVTPTATTTYYVTTTDYYNCYNIDSATIYILPSQPKPNVWVNNDTICLDDSAHLVVQGTGAMGYLWSTGATTNSINVFPSTTTTYTVTVMGDNSPCNDTVLTAIVFTSLAGNSGQSIIGNIYTCDTIETYTIINYDTNWIYILTIDDVNFDTLTSNQFTINWLNHINAGKGDTIQIIMREPYCDGIGHLYLNILSCCMPDSLTISFTDSVIGTNYPTYNPSLNRVLFTGETIRINDTLIINVNTQFEDCEIFMGPEAAFIIQNADSLIIDHSVIMACDTFMWNGIFVNDTIRHLSIINSSQVKDAQNAVVSTNGGGIYLEGSSFEDNYTNVIVSGYCPYLPTQYQSPPPPVPSPFNGYIAGCSFIGNRDLPYFPHKGEITKYGISIDSTYKFTIGDKNAVANTFRDMHFGIFARFASLYVYNNDFYNIYKTTSSNSSNVLYGFFFDAAIFSFDVINSPAGSAPNPPYLPAIDPYLEVGGSNAGEENNFDSCNTAVYSYHNRVKINNNNLDCRFSGIVCYDMWGNDNEIRNNYIEVHERSSDYSGIGIIAVNLPKQILDITITGNTIENPPKTGIWAQNCCTSYLPGSSIISNVSNNTVHFAQNNNETRYGLRFDVCDRLIAAYNQVINDDAIPVYDKMNGISISDCKNARVYKNYGLYHLGTGIRVAGNNIDTKIYCNAFDDCKHGFFFLHNDSGIYGVGTFISDQGDNAWASDNLWKNWNAGNMRMAGCINLDQSNPTPRKWYFRGLGYNAIQGFNPQIPLDTQLVNFISEMPGINSDYSFCDFPPDSPFPPNDDDTLSTIALRESKFGEIVRDEIEWATLAEEFDYSCTDYVWGEFNADLNWINLGTAEDTVYQNFYDYIYNSNIADFAEIRDLIESGDLDGALQENSNIIPENTYEINQQFVNNVYLDNIANFDEIPEENLQTLWQIASLTPWIGGPAVYTARIILGFDPDEHGLPYRYAKPNTLTEKVYSAKLFPNPASNQLEIEFNTYAGEFNISFYNILGELVFTKEILSNSNKYILNLDKIKTGIYFVNITKNKEVICKEKIVVIK